MGTVVTYVRQAGGGARVDAVVVVSSKLARDENVSTGTMAALAPYADTPRRFMGLAPRSDLDRIDRFVIRPLNEIHNAFPGALDHGLPVEHRPSIQRRA
jgi:hypothetical protein